MSLTSSLQRIVQAKADIKTAIEAKGVTVGNDVSIANYDDYIAQITGGGGTLTTKSITTNGTYNASSDDADGYSQVTVNVQPNLITKSITGNGTYNASSDSADGYSSVTVNVSGGISVSSITATLTANGYIVWSAPTISGLSGHTITSIHYDVYVNDILVANHTLLTQIYIMDSVIGGDNSVRIDCFITFSNEGTVQTIYIVPYQIKVISSLSYYITNTSGVVYGGQAYIFGGNTGTNGYQKNTVVNTLGTSSISYYSSMLPNPLGAMGVVLYGTYAYLFGGFASGTRYSTIIKVDLANKTYNILPTQLPYALNGMSAELYGNYVYLFGGNKGTVTNNILKFDLTNDTLTTLNTTLPYNVYQHGSCKYGNYVYLFGGYSGSSYYNKILKFDLVNETVSTLQTTLPYSMSGLNAQLLGTSEIVVFGFNNTSVVSFDPSTETVTTLGVSFGQNVNFPASVSDNGVVYIYGGSTNQSIGMSIMSLSKL